MIIQRYLRSVIVFSLFSYFMLPLARAQNAELTGAVTDVQGLPVPAAAISVRSESTGVHRETTSSSTGNYDVAALEPGAYTVRVEKQGFETMERTGLILFVATATRVDIHLLVGHETQTVSVNADASLLQLDSAQLSTTINKQQYDDLPLVQQGRIRSPAAFIYLAPGVQGNYSNNSIESTAATNEFVVNGSQMQVGEFYLGGLEVGQMRTVGSYNESAPPVDAVQEFKLITTLVPADYGHTGAVAGILEIRSGTNNYHGSIYEYLRNNALDAQPWGTVTPLFTRQNEFGATIGGPISIPKVYNGKNRSFFFFSYGGSRKSGVDAVQNMQIPTPQEINGNFAGQRTIYDPATTRLNAAGTQYIRDPFPGNQIPIDRMSSFARQVSSYFPSPNQPGVNNYQAFKGEKLLNPDVYTSRADHLISASQHIYFTFSQTGIPRLRVDTALPSPLNSTLNQHVAGTTARVNHDWSFGDKMLNSAAIGYYRFNNLIRGDDSNLFAVPNQIGEILPQITFANGYASIQTDGGSVSVENDFLGKDAFSWSILNHNLRFGGELRVVHFNDTAAVPGTNTIALSNLETANPSNTSSTGDAFASFLLGAVDNGSVAAPAETGTRYLYGGLFAEDDWKLTQRLTLNLGLRWEVQTPPHEAANNTSTVSLTTPNPGAGDLPGAVIYAGSGAGRSARTTFAPTNYTAIGPRLGLAFQATPKSVVRAGYGIFYSDLGLNLSSSGFNPSASFASPNNGVTPAFTLAEGYPSSQSLLPGLVPTLLNGQSASYFASSAGQMPRIQEWTGSIQLSPTPQWVFELAYVGNNSTRLIDSALSNINQVDPRYLSLGSLLTVSASSPAAQAAGIPLPYAGFAGSVAQALRAFPQYLTLTSTGAKAGYSNYNALQVTAEKRFSSGLSLGANYNFSKNLGSYTNSLQNALNPRAEYGLLPYDVRNAFILHYTYALPFGRGQKALTRGGWVDVVAGGWKVSGIQRYQSGFPLVVTTSNSLAIFNSTLRPNSVPGINRSNHLSANAYRPGATPYINSAAFSQPAPFSFGNASATYSDLANFPIYDEDLSIVKDTKISEAVTWSLYGSFFNAFNRHRFGSFDTTFTDASFGQASLVSEPRYVQIGTRIYF
jgi:Carboxypeptidase regulatory-like domain/TonB dependent receptor